MSEVHTPTLTRAHLARALDDLARWDRRLSSALTVCEAWQPGYCAGVMDLAEQLAAGAHPEPLLVTAPHELALDAVGRAVALCNPRQRARGLGAEPAPYAVQSLLHFLTSQVRLHEAAYGVERRRLPRVVHSGA